MIVKIPPRGPVGGLSGIIKDSRHLMQYLLGPGRSNEHAHPEMVASSNHQLLADTNRAIRQAVAKHGGEGHGPIDWSDPDHPVWQPIKQAASTVGEAIARPCSNPAARLTGKTPLWQGILTLHPTDRDLSAAEWDVVVRKLLDDNGMARLGDPNAVEWVAVRHGHNLAEADGATGADHVHIVANLVRPNGKRASDSNERVHAARTAAWAEVAYNLHHQDRSAKSQPGDSRKASGAKAAGKVKGLSEIQQVRAAVSVAAAHAWTSEQMIDEVRRAGYLVELRYSTKNPNEVTGWKVGAMRPGGAVRWYTATKHFGKDLTWPKLQAKFDALRTVLDGTGIIGEQEVGAMLSTKRMSEAGWGEEFIARILEADARLGKGEENPQLAYWLRDAFWQVAWTKEKCQGGPWTSAAMLYASIGRGEVPPTPRAAQEELAVLNQQVAAVKQRMEAMNNSIGSYQAQWNEAARRFDRADAAHRRLASKQRHVPPPPGVRIPNPVKMASIAAATRTLQADIRQMDQLIAEKQRANQTLMQLNAETQRHNAEGHALEDWLGKAGRRRAHLKHQIDQALDARQQWRNHVDELIRAAQQDQDPLAEEQVANLHARWGSGQHR